MSKLASLVSAFVVFFAMGAAFSQEKVNGNATLVWDAPLANADGSALTDLAGYEVGIFASDAVPNVDQPLAVLVDVAQNSSVLRLVMTLASLSEGQFRFAVLAVDQHNNKSVWSDSLDLDVKTKKPNPPANLRCNK